jgi:hypothetical protein
VKSNKKGGWFVTSRLFALMDDAYAFMLTDSWALRAFSSFFRRDALLRWLRSFMKALAST